MSEPMLTLHRARSRSLGPVVLVRGRTCPFIDQLRALTFMRRRRSGKVADGGPGHVVPADYVIPISRWRHSELIRAGTALLLAQANNAPLAEVTRLTREFSALKLAQRQRAASAPAHPSNVAGQLPAGGSRVHTPA